MNTGHDGSLTTGHANSPRDMLSRLETMVLMAGMDLPVRAIRSELLPHRSYCQQARLRTAAARSSRSRKSGMEGDVITLQDIFFFEQHGVDEEGRILGRLRPTGVIPVLRQINAGINCPQNSSGY